LGFLPSRLTACRDNGYNLQEIPSGGERKGLVYLHETYMATKAHTAQTRTWIYEAHGDPQWPSHSQSSPRQRALETYSLIVALIRALRLRKSSDFQRVRQQGRTIASRLLILTWMPNEVARLRIGFVVSKRISKRAVERNYIKRLLGEAMRPVLHELPIGWDIILSARNPASSANLQELKQDIITLLQRAHLLNAQQRSDIQC
jgi:ribonuclease P protein component